MTDFSYQLYSSRNFPPLGATLRMLARLGYRQVEGYGALYADLGGLDALRDELDAAGLTMPTTHIPLEMIEADPDRVLEIARRLDIGTIYVPTLPPGRRPETGAGYEALGRDLAEKGKRILDAGLGFGWHNHAFELLPLGDGAVPLAAIFDAAPDLEWQADLAWVVKSGADPFEWIRRLGRRLTAVHIKDIAPVGQSLEEDGWTDIGQGTVPWPGLMGALRETGVRYWVVEHDSPADDARFAETSLFALKGM